MNGVMSLLFKDSIMHCSIFIMTSDEIVGLMLFILKCIFFIPLLKFIYSPSFFSLSFLGATVPVLC